MWPFKWKLLNSTFIWYCLLSCTRWFFLLTLWNKLWYRTTVLKYVMKPFYFNFEILHVWRGQSCFFQGGDLTLLTIKLVILKHDVNSYEFSMERILSFTKFTLIFVLKLFVEASRLKGLWQLVCHICGV